ncbi:MFS transporter [Brachybacterium sp. JHP9]|uniref:MFS transporter n=1 Tax=Brachybacterium equifaecis TaxID=2910770 RepID=A0ABT0QZX6_9MICO|nr:MFS transporter [Brachybacterium equifaecis]
MSGASPSALRGSTRAPRPRLPREIHVLVIAAFVIAVGFGIVAPVLPSYAQSFNVGVTAASAVVSAFAFMRLVFAPAGGRLITRFGERPMYIAGLLIVALSTGAAAFAQSYGQLLVLRGLGGIGSTLFSVSAMTLLVRLAPPRSRGRASSLYGSAFLLGSIGGPALGSALAGLGYRAPFLIYAVSLLIAAGFVALFLARADGVAPGSARGVGAAGAAGESAWSGEGADAAAGSSGPAAPAPGPGPAMRVREAWADSAFRASIIGGFANGWANFGARMALIPLFIGALPHVPAATTGIALTVFAGANALGLLAGGRLVESAGRRPIVIAGLLIGAVGTLPMGMTDSPLVLYALSVIAGIGAGMLTPAQQVVLADVIGAKRSGGAVLAAFQMSQDAGAILGPILTGAIAAWLGFGWAFGVTGAILALGALAWLGGRETRGDAESEASEAAQAGEG